jgi:integrase/recombinase XerC
MNEERYFQYLQFEKRFSNHTLIAYKQDMNQFINFLSATYQLSNPAEINHTHIRSWIVDLLEKGNVARSINRRLSCLKTYFKFLRKQGLLEGNPMVKVIPPKTGKRLPVIVGEQSLSLLFEKVNFGAGFSGLRNRLVLEMLYCTGMRRSELAALKSSDIQPNHQLKVLGKRGKERLIPIAPHLAKMLEDYSHLRKLTFPASTASNLLLTDKGQPLQPNNVYSIVKKYLSYVTTQEQRSPHVLRHSFATHLSNNGADLNAIKELMGHSSLAATQIYTHNSIDKLKKVYQQAHPKAKLPSES